tara:strand:+ start:361 stop:801 length:441 start_codon:yes stop_codon:yes gene_type:complete
MHSYSKKSKLLFTTKQLYEIIIDVESYPEFLPWCSKCKIVSKLDKNNFDAELSVGYKSIDEKYTSRVKGIYLSSISSVAISGPFKVLESNWIFNNLPNDKKSCEVEFLVKYEFKSFILGKIMGAIFKKATERMFTAFENRAKDLYN